MHGITLTARLDPALHSAVLDIAVADDISPAQLIRDLLKREVSRRLAAPMPDQAQGPRTAGLLPDPPSPPNVAKSRPVIPDESDDDFDLIEDDWPPLYRSFLPAQGR